MKAIYYEWPSEITYMQLPNGQADVWLRKNIQLTTENSEEGYEEGIPTWECDEVSFRTSLSQEEIEENFDTIFENGGPVIDEETEEEVADGITLTERVEAAEAAIEKLQANQDYIAMMTDVELEDNEEDE